MKGKAVSGLMLILLLIGMLTLAFNIQPAKAVESGGIKLVPSSVVGFCPSDLYPSPNNTRFDVTVIISDITNCAGYQFMIHYNSTLLALDSWTFDTDPANPLSPTQMAPAPYQRVDTEVSIPGSLRVSTVWNLGVPAYSYAGDSVAARLTFKIIYIPPPPLMGENNTVSTQLIFDRAWTYWGGGGDIPVYPETFSDGYYGYTTREWLVGDVDGNNKVDVIDQRVVQLAMVTVPGDSDWNPNADVDGNLQVDVIDQRLQQLLMFESW